MKRMLGRASAARVNGAIARQNARAITICRRLRRFMDGDYTAASRAGIAVAPLPERARIRMEILMMHRSRSYLTVLLFLLTSIAVPLRAETKPEATACPYPTAHDAPAD